MALCLIIGWSQPILFMVKNSRLKWLVIPGLRPGMLIGLAALSYFSTVSAVNNPRSQSVLPPADIRPAVGNPAILDARRRLALGMIETGNNDDEVGGLGEVSRYQIMPAVWKQYSDSRSYRNPGVSLTVAQQHWTRLYTGFKKQAHREPSDFDMYVLWNTHYGYYARRGFEPARLCRTVRDRAQCFANLVHCGEL
jgi:hypothetical protein